MTTFSHFISNFYKGVIDMRTDVKFDYNRLDIERIKRKDISLFNMIVQREESTCVVCKNKVTTDKLRGYVIQDDVEPSLSNSVCVCVTCLGHYCNGDNKQIRLLIAPYLKTRKVSEFNKRMSDA